MRQLFKIKMLKLRKIYTGLLTFIGIIIVLLGIGSIPNFDDPFTLILLLFVAIGAHTTTTRFAGGNMSISVGGAISFAAVGLYSPLVGGMIAGLSELGIWLINSRSKKFVWKDELERVGANSGLQAISILVAGYAYVGTTILLNGDTFLGRTVPWFIGGIVGDQVNFWLLAVILYLASGVTPVQMWNINHWAIPMNILVLSLGGGLIYLAVTQFGILGLAIFILPIILSAYTFRLTVNNTEKQMAQLEEMVTLRTKELEEANEELTALHEEKNAFLAVLTHDMRTPLTSIKGYSSILRDRELAREQQVKIATVILNSQETLLDIVNNILDLEKMNSGNAPVLLEVTSFDLALVTKTAAESLQAPAFEKSISLTFDDVPSPIMVQADLSKIQRVLLNLISNAVKYTPEGGDVCVTTTVNGRYAYVEIKDTGYGIPEDELPHIFDRYSRVKGHQHLAIGTGLGLAIVQSLVEAHDGEISVTSKVDEGSTFTVKLPTNY